MQEFDVSGLKPAMAGFLVDGKIEYREVIATIVDFIQKGIVSYNDRKLSLGKTPKSLLYHERELLNQLFGGIVANDEKEGIDQFIDYNSIISFAELDAINLGLAEPVESKSPILFSLFSSFNRYFTRQYLLQEFPKIAWKWLTCPLFIITYFLIAVLAANSLLGFSPELKLIVSLVLFFPVFLIGIFWFILIVVVPALLLVLFIAKQSKTELKITQKGILQKKKYLELKKFLEEFPVEKDLNLSKEFLPFQIAFGLNTVWNELLEKSSFETGKIKAYASTFSYNSSGHSATISIQKGKSIVVSRKEIYEKNSSSSAGLKKTIAAVKDGSLEYSKGFKPAGRISFSGKDAFFDGKKLFYSNGLLFSNVPIAKISCQFRKKSLFRSINFIEKIEYSDLPGILYFLVKKDIFEVADQFKFGGSN